MVLPITKLPAKVLRTPTEEVTFPLSKEVKRLLIDMVETVKKANGIGLAAPQVGKNFNLAIIYLVDAGLPAFPIINPKITDFGKKKVEIEEGCLSLPGVFGIVKRPQKITVKFQDAAGKFHTITDDGWLARVCQHEIDHLNSTLIADKLESITHGQELLKDFLKEN